MSYEVGQSQSAGRIGLEHIVEQFYEVSVKEVLTPLFLHVIPPFFGIVFIPEAVLLVIRLG